MAQVGSIDWTMNISANIDELLEIEKHLQDKDKEIAEASEHLKTLKEERNTLIASMRKNVLMLGRPELPFRDADPQQQNVLPFQPGSNPEQSEGEGNPDA